MGGKPNKPRKPGHWERECNALEEQLGYAPGVIYTDFRVTVLLRERKSVAYMPREVHEEMAMLNVIDLFGRVGMPAN